MKFSVPAFIVLCAARVVSSLIILPAANSGSARRDCAGTFSGHYNVCDGLDWAGGHCALLVSTNSGSCSDYCAGQGAECFASADNIGSTCVASPNSQGRSGTPMTASFCSATFDDQICVCSQAASATGDPHLQNVHGERFDLARPGNFELIRIPRGQPVENALLVVQAHARQVGGRCSDMYFVSLNVTGAWADAARAGGFRFDADGAGEETPKWSKFGPVEIKIVRGHTAEGTRYLNVYVKHLGRAGLPVGGLLGEDDYKGVSTPPAGCFKRMSLRLSGPRERGRSSEAASAAEGKLE